MQPFSDMLAGCNTDRRWILTVPLHDIVRQIFCSNIFVAWNAIRKSIALHHPALYRMFCFSLHRLVVNNSLGFPFHLQSYLQNQYSLVVDFRMDSRSLNIFLA